ncbi:hypothetical protein T06_3212 [Trichinella sp. T6]|nr:hypothetical protein T06_3212 [Trichinella sp. T6]
MSNICSSKQTENNRFFLKNCLIGGKFVQFMRDL